MGTKLRYKPGSFYRVCDLTGFSVRAEDTRKQWNNYIVRNRSFEERNAQDFVRGRRDDQTVPNPRPRSTNQFLGGSTTLAAVATIRSQTVFLSGPIGLVAGNVVSIMLDNGVNFFVAVTAFIEGDFNSDFNFDFSQANMLFIAQPLPFQASAGNAVVNTDYVAVTPPSLQPVGS